jgi:hypothetical protein
MLVAKHANAELCAASSFVWSNSTARIDVADLERAARI